MVDENRRVKFKTLDNQVFELEVNRNISILDLKKIIMEKKGMPVEGQRLIFQGRQLKNEHFLNDLIKEDDLIIHLMSLTPEQLSNISQQSSQHQNMQQQEQQPLHVNSNNNENINSASIVSMLHNMLNNNIAMPGQNTFVVNQGGNGLNSNLNQTLINPLLQPISQQIDRNQNQHQTQMSQPLPLPQPHPYPSIINPNSSFPISTSPTDARYYDLLTGINSNLDLLANTLNKENNESSSDKYNLPITNSVQNILTALSRSLRYYNDKVNQFIPQLNRLTDLLEREELLTTIEERNKGNELINQCSIAFDLISQSSNSLNQIISNSNFGNAPNAGFVNVINTEIGIVASMSLPFGQLTTHNQTTNNDNTTSNQSNMSNAMAQILQPENLQMADLNNNTRPIANTINQQYDCINGINTNSIGTSLNENHTVQHQTETMRKEKQEELLNKIAKDPQLKETMLLKDTMSVIPLNIHRLFASFVNKILVNMTIKEIEDLFEFNFNGLIKQYNSIQAMVSSANKSNLLSQIIQFIITAIKIEENDKHTKNNNHSIDLQCFLRKYCIMLFDILFEPNKTPTNWGTSLSHLCMTWIKELYTMLSNVYTTGNEGSLYCLIKNTEELLMLIVGEEWLNAINKYQPALISQTVEKLIALSLRPTNESKISSSQDNIKAESFPLVSMTEILRIASRDQDRIAGDSLLKIKFSDTYHNSSLFKE